MVGRWLISFWNGPFSGGMLIFGDVSEKKPCFVKVCELHIFQKSGKHSDMLETIYIENS